jgi:hypothetical protein
MRNPLRSLRYQLAGLNLIVSGLVLLAFCAGLLVLRERDLRGAFDERLVARAERLAEFIASVATATPSANDQRSDSREDRAVRFPGLIFQIRDNDGRIIRRSRNLRNLDLPPLPVDRAMPALETLDGPIPSTIFGARSTARLISMHWTESGPAPFYLQVAANLAPVTESVRRLRRLLIALLGGSLIVIAIGSLLSTSRSLKPIGAIVDTVDQITGGAIQLRIQTPIRDDEVAGMVRTLNTMLDRLQNTFEAQERFVADASHELKTPVTVLLGEAQVLRQQTRSIEDYDRFVASVEQEMRRLGRVVDSLLTLARADAGIPPAGAVDVPVNDLVTEVVQRCEPLASQREVRLVPRLTMPEPDEPEPCVHGDPELLRTALENLIRNSIRHSPVGEAIDVNVEIDRDSTSITVLDNGPGIPEEYIDHIFDRFFSAPQPGTPNTGSGLGLAITKGVVELHGGTIRTGNRPEGGISFVMHLPLAGPPPRGPHE